jgi:hypothetical protein
MQKESEKDKQLQRDAGATLLDEGMKFKVKWIFGIKLPLSIKPLHPATIVKISQQQTMLKDVQEGENLFYEMLKTAGNLNVIAKIAALATLNSRWKIMLFTRVLTSLLLWRVESTKEMFTLMAMVYRQMGAEHFFFIMQLTSGMNFLKRKTTAESTGEVTPSGVQSP